MNSKPIQHQQPGWRSVNRVVNIVAVSTLVLFALFVIGLCWVFFSPASPRAEITISEYGNARLEVYEHWTGGFSGWQHNEYLVYYVRPGSWISSDQKTLLPCGETAYGSDIVKFRRVDATKIELIRINGFTRKDTTIIGRYSAGGYSL